MSGAMTAALGDQLAAPTQPRRQMRCAHRRRQGFLRWGDVKDGGQRRRHRRRRHHRRAIHRQRVNQRATAGRLFKMPKPTIAALQAPRRRGPVAPLACDLADHGLERDPDHRLRPRRLFPATTAGPIFLTQLVGSARRESSTTSPTA